MKAATEARLPTGTVTFLFSDIEGSTRLLAALGDRYPPLLDAHSEIVRGAIGAHEGTVVSTEGDSFFAVFPSAQGAVRAAANIQRGLAEHPWPPGSELSVRIGIHTGEGRLGADNYVGMDVHRASRIAAAAHGGQTIISATTQALVGAELEDDLSLADLGPHRLKDLPSLDRLWQLDVDGLPHDFPALRSLDARPNNLPEVATPLIGRGSELRILADLLQRRPLLTITGPGGAGKTRLALAAGRQALPGFADGVFIVPLEEARDRPSVVSAIAVALGVREKPDRDLEEGVLQFVRERELLLILDNFEQVISAAPLVSEMLTRSSGLRVVVTSREVLHLSAEQTYDVPPLALPDPAEGRLPDLDALSQYEAVALFIERAQAVKPDFALTAENASAVAQICARLDGLPLAIELAAARLKLLTPAQVLERLDHRLSLLSTGAADLPERQRTLRGAIEWSFELLDERERRLLERLAVFAGGWTLDAAEAVARPTAELGIDLLEGLSSLADKSLVRVVEDEAEPRLDMLQVLREFALEKLEARGEAQAIRRRHAEHVMAFAERVGPELVGFEMRDWNLRLRRDGENLRSALRWALDTGELDIGLRTASAIWRYWHYWGVPREGRDWVQALLDKPGAPPELASRAKGLAALASLTYWLGDMSRADDLYAQALDIYRQLGDEARVTETIDAMCWTAVGQGDFEAAMARVQEAMERYRSLGDRAGVARMNAWLKTGGFFAGFGVPADEALAASHEVVVTEREQGNAWNMINAQGEIAGVYRRLGDIPRALAAFRATAELYVGLGYLGMLPWLKFLASMEISRGDANRAATLAAIAQRAVEELGGELPEEITQVGNPLEDARGLLPEEAFVAAVAKGRAMGFDEAIAYALET
jgi:predicted ATPase/class 3 adenylate cyclase